MSLIRDAIDVLQFLAKPLKFLWWAIWRFGICAAKKLLFPAKDVRSGIKQSRMRYYFVRFEFRSGLTPTAYQVVDSNGNVVRFQDRSGRRFLPEEACAYDLIGDKKFQCPLWVRTAPWRGVDWKDVFNGNPNSGFWGISER